MDWLIQLHPVAQVVMIMGMTLFAVVFILCVIR